MSFNSWRAHLTAVFKNFSRTEYGIFWLLGVMVAISGLLIALDVSKRFMVEVPSPGGVVREGLVGTPRFINPLLSLSDADRDMITLIYSGLLKAAPDGTLVPDLAESFEISSDGKTYTFTLKQEITFHDGTPVTADDVVFTVERALDPLVKSPKRANWESVTLEKINERQVKFILKQPYAPFIENMTMGILPQHIWKDTDAETFSFSQFNTEPIGSGPYRVSDIKTNRARVPVLYSLRPFANYTFGRPFIDKLILRFYSHEQALLDAFERREIDSMSAVSPIFAEKARAAGFRLETAPLPRVFGVFFNQNQALVFTQAEVRKALDLAAPRLKIVSEVLGGYGNAIKGPIPPGLWPPGAEATTTVPTAISTSTPALAARKLLEKSGWKANGKDGVLERKTAKQTFRLEFTIATANTPDLKRTAELLKTEWEKIGARVTINSFDVGDLNQFVIRPRKYDALLFGEIIGRDLDLFAFWHSSQRNDPGLNIALYTNAKADALLQEARALSDAKARLEKYRQFETEIEKDVPAVFLYSPDFIYLIPSNLRGFSISKATVPSERFESVERWHSETDHVWKIFAAQK